MRKPGEKKPAKAFLERPFWKFFAQIGDFFVLSLFWVLTSLPIVTIGASTAALFYVFFKTRAQEQGTLWGMYKKSFLENAKQGTLLWLIYLFVALDIVIICYMLCGAGICAPSDFSEGGKFFAAWIVLALCYVSVLLYSAALLGMFRQTMAQCVASAVSLTFSRIFSTLLFLLIIAALAFATFYIFPALVFIDVPLAIYLISLRMYVLFKKQVGYAEKREREAQQA